MTLREQEADALTQLDNRARKLMSQNPSLTYAKSYERAMAQLPHVYEQYLQARAGLIARRIPPILTPER